MNTASMSSLVKSLMDTISEPTNLSNTCGDITALISGRDYAACLGSRLKSGLLVSPIKNGVVIDHIPAGRALVVLKILGLTGREGLTITIAMNVESRKMGRKDIVKIADRELKPEEVDKIALIAPNATLNIIRNYEVVEKHRVKPPALIRGILRCPNPTCVTNTREPVEPVFVLVRETPVRLRCSYCDEVIEMDNIVKQLAEGGA